MSSPAERRCSNTGHPSGYSPPSWALPNPFCPSTPYPRSRGIQAHVLPGRSGGRTGTSPPPPPTGCKSRLVMERDECPSASWSCQAPNQSPHQIPFHLPPAVRRPPATASPLEDPPLPSPGDTYGGAPGQEVRTQSSSLLIPEPPPLPALMAVQTCMCAHTHPGSHRCCRSFSRRSLPRLDMMSSGTLGGEEWTLEVGEEGSGYLGFWWALFGVGGNFLAVYGIREGKSSQALTWW